MAGFSAQLENVVVANAGTDSRAVDTALECADATGIYIEAPATLAETPTIQTSCDGTTWVTLNNGTSDVAPPLAGKGCVYDNLVAPYWRIHFAGAAAAERIFKVRKIYNAY